jgi:hypothetical protein
MLVHSLGRVPACAHLDKLGLEVLLAQDVEVLVHHLHNSVVAQDALM